MAVDNSKIVYGGDMMLFTGSGTTKNPVAFSTSAKLSINLKVRDISSKDSGTWTDKAAGKFDWNMSTEGLLAFSTTGATTSIDTAYKLMSTRDVVNVVFASKTGSSPVWTVNASLKNFTGKGIITSLDMNASDGDNATYSINIEGSGALTLA